MNSLNKRKSPKEDYKDFQKGFENENRQIKLSEAELKQVVKEAAMKLINEYNQKQARTKRFIRSKHGNRKMKTGDPIKDKPIFDAERNRELEKSVSKQMEESSDIEIKPSKRGTFTAAATKHGKSVQGFANQVLKNKGNYSPAMVKKANFAKNFGGKKK
jgi:hypothetical protein